MSNNPHVIVSNGFNKFHLSVAAAEIHRRGALAAFITGAYPLGPVKALLSSPPLSNSRKLLRLRARVDEIPDHLITAVYSAEAFEVAAAVLSGRLSSQSIAALHAYSFRRYARRAVEVVKDAANGGAKVYHYRAGMGLASVPVAKQLGMYALCDHSIAHPAVLDDLVQHNGTLDPTRTLTIDPFWTQILGDIDQADSVLVNSTFVKQTFLGQGWPTTRVHVIYLGVDDAFLEHVAGRSAALPHGPIRLIFAGRLEIRKGVEQLVSALTGLDGVDWTLTIAGDIPRESRAIYSDFLADRRVNAIGIVSRARLAHELSKAEVFIFPSLAEGSARVVFEALACGCYVITTPNSGSIVEDSVHGRIVPPGNSEALIKGIQYAAQNRENVLRVGLANANCVATEYRQRHYGDKLMALYRSLATQDPQRIVPAAVVRGSD